jgi:hypothetical protein
MFCYIQEELWIINGNSLANSRRAQMVSAGGIMFTSSFCNGLPNNPQTQPLSHLTCRRIVMLIAIYARVSSQRQQQHLNIDQQLDRLYAYIAQLPNTNAA